LTTNGVEREMKYEMYKSLTDDEKEEYYFRFANTKIIFFNYLQAGSIFLISTLAFLAIAGILAVVTTESIIIEQLYDSITLVFDLLKYTTIILCIGFIVTTYKLFSEYNWINNIKYNRKKKLINTLERVEHNEKTTI
jgi:hypothetical protein